MISRFWNAQCCVAATWLDNGVNEQVFSTHNLWNQSHVAAAEFWQTAKNDNIMGFDEDVRKCKKSISLQFTM